MGVDRRVVDRSQTVSTDKRVDDAYAGIHEIGTVARGDRELMNGRCSRDEAVFDRHRLPGFPKPRQQFSPFKTCVRIPRQAVETPNSCIEPAFQRSPLSSPRKDENSESQFAENDRIDGDLRLICAEPLYDSEVGHRFGRFAQDVGVDQVFHSVSVDSESTGTKKPFCGQESSQSVAPSLGGAARRTRR